MSSTARGGKRSPADFYATPPFPTHRLLEALPLPGGRWIEPCAGEGSIIKAVDSVRSDVVWTGYELREECRTSIGPLVSAGAICSFLDVAPPSTPFDVSITNPPFSVAMEMILHSLKFATWVIHLLRLNFFGSKKRNKFFRAHMPDVYVVPDRISFAISVSCKSCEFAVVLPLDADPPRRCPQCGDKTTISTTDSIEYAWFVFGPERNRRKGLIEVLEHTPEEKR